MKLTFATRPSRLARWQTQWVISLLQKAHPGLKCKEIVVSTQGDKILDKPLPEIGGKGLFTHDLEGKLLSGEVNCAVHSLKDLPIVDTPGLTIGCIPPRADVRDVLVSARGYTLATLPPGAVIGTSSLRRTAQILALRPDVHIASLRGNIDTRLRKALEEQYTAIVLAGAGLSRLGLEAHVTEWLSLEVMLPAPGQGALAVQCRADDAATLNLLAPLEDSATRMAVTSERQFLLSLGGGCSAPVAAYAHFTGKLHLTGLATSPDGSKLIRVFGQDIEACELGRRLAEEALAKGAGSILGLELPAH